MPTLEELENTYLGNPPKNCSQLIQTCYLLRQKKLSDYTAEDFRIMISQNMGLQFLMPLAVQVIETNPFAEGDYYEGDLLKSILTSDKNFWQKNQALKKEVINIFESNQNNLELLDVTPTIKQSLKEAFTSFKTY
ncbi:MAG TPA: contact-dependent growth inhibition system immunity protein [Bacteroidia bacterium]|nr:contact-dependent growth inhibition system immunity protein [Bacteroidia bacterium]